jgi:hypothetical protein
LISQSLEAAQLITQTIESSLKRMTARLKKIISKLKLLVSTPSNHGYGDVTSSDEILLVILDMWLIVSGAIRWAAGRGT